MEEQLRASQLEPRGMRKEVEENREQREKKNNREILVLVILWLTPSVTMLLIHMIFPPTHYHKSTTLSYYHDITITQIRL